MKRIELKDSMLENVIGGRHTSSDDYQIIGEEEEFDPREFIYPIINPEVKKLDEYEKEDPRHPVIRN